MNTCKNPDKIYIQPNAHDEWFEGNKPNDNLVEYIRKDALLEWAKVYKEEAEVSARGRTDNPSWGESVAIKALVNFINSL